MKLSRRRQRQYTSVVMALAALAASLGTARAADGYAEMLGYLAQTRIDERALAGASGAVAVNMAAGDQNQQANLRAIAVGDAGIAHVDARQRHDGDVADAPLQASASIGGSALSGAGGLVSINQASGSGNAEVNAVSLALAQQGMREAPAGRQLSTSEFASAERRRATQPAGKTASRNVAVEATALRGFEGVLQLNQIAGSANETGNVLTLSLPAGP